MYLPGHFYRLNAWCCLAVGYLFNGALLWLVAKRSEHEMATYRPILLLSTVVNLVYLAVTAVVVPMMPSERGQVAVFSMGPLGWLPQPYNFALVFAYVFILFFSSMSKCVVFVYRYALLCHKKKYRFKEYVAMLIFPLLVTIVHVSNCFFAGYVPGAHQQRALSSPIFNTSHLSETQFSGRRRSEVPLVVPYFVEGAATLFIDAYMGASLLVNYLLVGVLGWRIYRHLKQETTSTLSAKRAAELNQQVSRALLAQAFIPLVVEAGPSFWLFALSAASRDLDSAGAYVVAIFAWEPVLDPLATVWVVRAYRREVARWLTCGRLAVTNSVIVLNHQQQQQSGRPSGATRGGEGGMRGSQGSRSRGGGGGQVVSTTIKTKGYPTGGGGTGTS